MSRKGAICAIVVGLGACNWAFGLTTQGTPDAPDAPPPDAAIPPSSWASVAAGIFHTCGIHVDQTLWCWGRDDSGQLGLGPGISELDVPTQVGSDLWLHVAASSGHTCGIKLDHTLWCWGDNTYGDLGTGLMTNGLPAASDVPAPVAGGNTWTAVATSSTMTCAIDTAATLWCWGNNDHGNLGINGTGPVQQTPVAVMATGMWSAVAVSFESACALQTSGALWCWGYGGYGTLGQSSTNDVLVPTQVGGDLYKTVAMGTETACAVRADGRLRCWGEGDHGELGNDNTAPSYVPTAVSLDDAFWSDVSVGGYHTCGLHQDGTLWCWGSNVTGELASDTGTKRLSTIPVAVASAEGAWQALAAGDGFTCAIGTDGRLWCAGRDSGALGVPGGGSRTAPAQVGTAETITAGGYGGCTIATGALACWGYNGLGMVGDGTIFDARAAVPVSGTWKAVVPGASHTCGIDSNGAAQCWGQGYYGDLGTGMTMDSPTPVPVAGAGPWSAIASGLATCAIASGTMHCWGNNAYGNAGQPTTTNPVLSPLPVAGTSWTEVASADLHSCGIDSTGLYCWGDNGVGELGVGGGSNPMPSTTSVLPGTLDGLTAGGDHSCARSNGQYYCWGGNAHGELGNQSTAGGLPMLVSGMWAQLAAGAEFTCGVMLDGSLWCWGANEWGQLGLGTRDEHHEPKRIGSDTDWAAVTAGIFHACARKQDQRVYCWGRNLEGEVGDGKAWRTDLEVVP